MTILSRNYGKKTQMIYWSEVVHLILFDITPIIMAAESILQDEMIEPKLMSCRLILIQKATAAPASPHVSGRVIQASV